MIPKKKTIKVKIKKKNFKIKNCTGLRSVRGLMFDSMEDKHGALIYANNIWMPFVKHDLDLMFLDENMKVLSMERAVPVSLRSSTWRTYRNEDAKYCLELKAGLIKGKVNKIKIISGSGRN
ncbi:DUF192 domain-containing protein [Candidatus Aenigmatarchaeota archaeon]